MKKLLAVGAIAVTAALVPVSAASAQVRERAVDQVKTRCLNQIDRRQRALSAEKTHLDQAKKLNDDHEAALDAINDKTASGLTTLANTIQSEDNVEELRTECRSIVTDFRVFALVRPQARLVVAADRELAAAARLTEVANHVNSDDMKTHIAAAKEAASGVYESVIHLTPADFNANQHVLDGARTAVRTARDELKQAVAAGRAARQTQQSSGA